ncbi:unnamed protein product [Prorocentrum cordatum]|uniref:FACT complex subunit n=1 Tax=Prorocentrum cordatum TaxID=2364126 RepID=A0ABN9WDJ5_9DINO|nr:unnamed protein product [Polarella glacialis]
MLVKKVAARVFEGAASAAVDLHTGKVDVKKLAAHVITWNDDELSEKVTHRSSGDVVDIAKGYKWSKEFRIASPLVGAEAQVCRPGDRTGAPIFKFFPLGKGPHKYMVDPEGDGLKQRTENHSREIDEEIDKARAGEACADDKLPPSAEKVQIKRKASKMARQSAKEKRQKMEQGCDE